MTDGALPGFRAEVRPAVHHFAFGMAGSPTNCTVDRSVCFNRRAIVEAGAPVEIGNRVRAGARVSILPGAVIESDVIIAAGVDVAGRCASHGDYAGVRPRRIHDCPAESAA